jgi:anthranilate phosphoribosyltransferase
MDEFSPLGLTTVMDVRDGEVREWTVDPIRLGIGVVTAAELTGGTPKENARIVTAVLSGEGTMGATWAVVMNAAAALLVAERVSTYADGIEAAREGIRGGAGMEALERLRAAYRA